MRRPLLGLAIVALVAAACAPKSTTSAASGSPTAQSCTVDTMNLQTPGKLTIATGNPAYLPWYGGKSVPGSDWKSSSYTGDPHTGQGYESAFAYALAQQMGFTKDQVEWLGIPFGKSFAPGPKDFDFAMQQISITAKRAQAVDFSDGYYDVNQALIADNGSPAIGVTTLAGLKDLKLGAPVGTTSLQVIQDVVQPNVEPAVYPDLDTALKDLKNGQIDGVVVDFPDAFYGYADQIVGQFPPIGGQQEQFGLAFEKGNTLVSCVDQAIAALKSNGTLQQLQDTWLQTDASVPVFS
ncbi:MAG: ABC transporter substrate-binding protein [Actinomycetota bacterium]|nr:ABC transporter substrate-binding protein [Actinomycetota bacterium]